MKLEIESVEIKNFFCFGNKWQKVILLPGINLISGFDSSTARSNGSGKSSFIDSIVFGLFGQTTKDVNKPQIINWKNKKECEVKIFFKKMSDKYYIHRGLKPNFIRVYKCTENSTYTELDQLSSILDIQEYIEKNILEIDFDTFVSIIHYNPTISKSIFNVQKSQKRSFIEKIFGLEMYSDIMRKCNEKSLYINSKLVDSTRTIEFNQKNISILSEQNVSLRNTISDVVNKEHILNKKNELDELLVKINEDKKVIDDITGKSSVIDDKLNTYTLELDKLSHEIYSIESELKKYNNIESIEFDINKYTDICYKLEKMSIISYNTDTLYDTIEKLNIDIANLTDERIKSQMILKDIDIEITNIDKLSSGVCPLCTHVIEKENVETRKNSLLIEKTNHQCMIEQINKQINEISSNIISIKKDISIINEKYKEYTELQKTGVILEKHKLKYDIFNENKINIDELIVKLKKLVICKNTCLNEIEKLTKMKTFVDKKNKNISNNWNALNILTFQLSSLEKSLIEQEKTNFELNSLIDANNIKISEFTLEAEAENKKIKSYKNMIDYLEFIKKMCKDENVKQYAISNVVPFLSQRANIYLADAGFDFYLKLDNWLNVEIKGSGIREGTFGNLSSGQQKTTNLAMILAFLDIFKLQTAIWPDILLLDEILDGAIDSITLTQMFNIISKKQKEDNLKLFIVSHRKEINEIGQIDNFYRIEMQKGFSKITKVG